MKTLQHYAHYVIILGLVLILVSVSQLAQGQAYWADALAQGTIPTPTPEQSDPPPSDGGDQNDDSDDSDQDSGDTASDQPVLVPMAGNLLDANNAPLSNVRVRVAEVADAETVTNAEGRFSLDVFPGNYTLIFINADGEELGRQPVVVDSDGVTDLQVTPQPVEEQAEMTAAPTESDTSGSGDAPTETTETSDTTETVTETTTADAPAATEQTTETTQTAETSADTSTTGTESPAASSDDTTSSESEAGDAPETLPDTGEGYLWVLTLVLGVVFVGFGLLLSRKVQVQ